MGDAPGLPPEFRVVEARGLVLTAGRRLAAHLRARYDRGRLARGDGAWESPEILPLSAWARRAWAGQWPERVLLSEAQALAVWEEVVGARLPPGMNGRQLARGAAETHALGRAWRLSVDPAGAGASEEVRAFLAWERAYEAACRERGWADPAEALPAVAELIRAGAMAPPREVRHAGFDRVPPAVQDLLDAMAGAGANVGPWPAAAVDGARAVRLEAPDPAREALLAARWARARLAAGAASVGIVAPDVAAVRFQLERALRAQLAPGSVADPAAGAPVNVSLGVPLATVPVCADALACLRVGGAPQEIGRLRAVLRSPHLEAARAEAGPRAQAERRVLEAGWGPLTLRRLRDRLAAVEPPVPAFVETLGRWEAHLRRQGGARAPSAWAVAFDRLLAAVGWPGEGALSSALYQAVRRWRELLGEFARMDAVAGPIERGEAVARVERMARDTLFQPEGDEAPVQVLGVLEAAGMTFDHLWVLGLTAQAWPCPARPTPFLPYPLQRAREVPHATPEVELAFARAVTERLRGAAPEVVLSHPAQVEGRETRPSPLITDVPEAGEDGLDLAEDARYVLAVAAAGPPEAVADGQAPPVAAGEDVHGGAAVFEDQSRCPFRAFARHRLKAEPPAEPRLGLDAAERGSLPHRVLEGVWRELGGSEGLAAHPPEAARELVARVVEREIGAAIDRARGLPDPYLANERERLVALVADWLEVERARALPFTVQGIEEKARHEAGGTRVRLRVDRIDRLADGSEMLIDYKTGGNTGRTQWDGERPEAPQLPLYATARDPERLGAVAFARLRRDGSGQRFEGYTRVPGAFADGRGADRPLGPDAWRDKLAAWGEALEALGREFAEGRADVAPTDYPASCRYCGLEVLCRIAEREGAPDA